MTLQRRDTLITNVRDGVGFPIKHKLRSSNFRSVNLFDPEVLIEAKAAVDKATEQSYAAHALNKQVNLSKYSSKKKFSFHKKKPYFQRKKQDKKTDSRKHQPKKSSNTSYKKDKYKGKKSK